MASRRVDTGRIYFGDEAGSIPIMADQRYLKRLVPAQETGKWVRFGKKGLAAAGQRLAAVD
ncbi:hypothetical protein AB8880_09545 [Alphaproteobacteria bacterium LSUCC0684]